MNWIEKFKADENAALKELYLLYREEFTNWSYQKFQLDQDAAIEIFQTSVVIIYDNVISGKLKELSSSIKTYLFAICKNKILEYKRKSQKISGEEAIPTLSSHLAENEDKLEMETQFKRISKALEEMGDPCKSILQMFYYKQMKMDQISSTLGYKNVDTTKNQKYKCIKRLQKRVLDHKYLNIV